MSDLTQAQFRTAVAAAIGGVEHLYRQVDLLIARLREELAEDPDGLTLKRGTLGKAGKAESKRVVVRYEYGALFEPATDDGEDAEDGDEDEDEPEATGKRGSHELVSGQPLLAVRIAMFDPRRRADFEPQVQFAVMNDWALGDMPFQADDRFRLQAYMLKRLARALADRTGPPSVARIRTGAAARPIGGSLKGKDRKLTCSLPGGVSAVPLYEMSDSAAVERLAADMKAMWSRIAAP